eukprot:2626873-Rhodomonas_salina.1
MACYAMSGTELRRMVLPEPRTSHVGLVGRRPPPIVLRCAYAMSGPDISYAATSPLSPLSPSDKSGPSRFLLRYRPTRLLCHVRYRPTRLLCRVRDRPTPVCGIGLRAVR